MILCHNFITHKFWWFYVQKRDFTFKFVILVDNFMIELNFDHFMTSIILMILSIDVSLTGVRFRVWLPNLVFFGVP